MSTISTEGIEDMERRRLQPSLPEPPGLEHRIAACLQGGDIAADALAELISEVRNAVGEASAAAEAARARAFDPAVLDHSARRRMEQADHLARRLRLALPQLQNKLQKLHDAEEYRQWAGAFDAVKHKHTAAANKLREVYQDFEQKMVSVLTTAHQVDGEVRKVLDSKPRDNPYTDGDRKTLPSVELAARGLTGVAADYSIMTMKLPCFAEPNKLAWPPPSIPIGVQVVAGMAVPRGPSPDWQRDIAERDRERRQEGRGWRTITPNKPSSVKSERLPRQRSGNACATEGHRETALPLAVRSAARADSIRSSIYTGRRA